jgi:hypothetical protein
LALHSPRHGELLRRTQRRSEARFHLRAALALFEDLGAEPLVSRAMHELRATGETARKRDTCATSSARQA